MHSSPKKSMMVVSTSSIPSAYIPEGLDIPQFSFLKQTTTSTSNTNNNHKQQGSTTKVATTTTTRSPSPRSTISISTAIPSAYVPEGVELPEFSLLKIESKSRNVGSITTDSINATTNNSQSAPPVTTDDGNESSNFTTNGRYFLGTKNSKEEESTNTNDDAAASNFLRDVPKGMKVHKKPTLGCDCGCVPAIPTLFEMAELRKQAKALKEKQQTK